MNNQAILLLIHIRDILTRFRHRSLVVKSIVEVILSGHSCSDSKHVLNTRYSMDDCVVLPLEVFKTMNGIIGLKSLASYMVTNHIS